MKLIFIIAFVLFPIIYSKNLDPEKFHPECRQFFHDIQVNLVEGSVEDVDEDVELDAMRLLRTNFVLEPDYYTYIYLHQPLNFAPTLEDQYDRGGYPPISLDEFLTNIFYVGKAKWGRGLEHLGNKHLANKIHTFWQRQELIAILSPFNSIPEVEAFDKEAAMLFCLGNQLSEIDRNGELAEEGGLANKDHGQPKTKNTLTPKRFAIYGARLLWKAWKKYNGPTSVNQMELIF